jgi:predicted nucleic acid-binding protein
LIALATNVLVYAVSDHPLAPEAGKLVAAASRAGALLPTQVLAEFANVCRKKAFAPATEIAMYIRDLQAGFTTEATSDADVIAAVELSQARKLQFFDALIVAVARRAGISFLLSEDMQDGLRLGALMIINPFAPENAPTIADLLSA